MRTNQDVSGRYPGAAQLQGLAGGLAPGDADSPVSPAGHGLQGRWLPWPRREALWPDCRKGCREDIAGGSDGASLLGAGLLPGLQLSAPLRAPACLLCSAAPAAPRPLPHGAAAVPPAHHTVPPPGFCRGCSPAGNALSMWKTCQRGERTLTPLPVRELRPTGAAT